MPDHPQPPFPLRFFARETAVSIFGRSLSRHGKPHRSEHPLRPLPPGSDPPFPQRGNLRLRTPGEHPAAGTYGAKRTHSDMPPANRLRPSRRNDDLRFFTLNFLHRHRVLRPEEGGPIRQGRSSDSFPLHAFPPRRGSGSKSAQSMTELTATGIVPDSHRRSLLIPCRQPPAGNLASSKSRNCPPFRQHRRPVFNEQVLNKSPETPQDAPLQSFRYLCT